MCAVPAVSSAYAVGPASPATRARPSGAVASASRARRDPGTAARRASAGPASTLLASTGPAAATPAASTTQRSHGSQPGVRSSRMNAHTALARTPVAAAMRPARGPDPGRACHKAIAPIPTRAAMPGASATM